MIVLQCKEVDEDCELAKLGQRGGKTDRAVVARLGLGVFDRTEGFIEEWTDDPGKRRPESHMSE